jgi:hypothetical protein
MIIVWQHWQAIVNNAQERMVTDKFVEITFIEV